VEAYDSGHFLKDELGHIIYQYALDVDH
jgi:hypothetical protein